MKSMTTRVPTLLTAAALSGAALLPRPEVIAQEVNPHFATTLTQLDTDGDLLVYLNYRNFVNLVGGVLDFVEEIGMEGVARNSPEKMEEVRQVVGIAKTVAGRLGLHLIGDMGISSRKMEDNLFRARSFMGRKEGADTGLIWIPPTGPEASAWPGLDLVPKDSLLAWGGRPRPEWFLDQAILLMKDTPAEGMLEQALTQAKEDAGLDIRELIASIGDEMVLSVALDPSMMIPLDPPVGPVPSPGIGIALKLKSTALPDLILSRLKAADAPVQEISLSNQAVKGILIPKMSPVVLPCWTVTEDHWWLLASQTAVLQRMLDAKEGKAPTLKDHDEFKSYGKYLPERVDGWGFASEAIGAQIRAIANRAMAQNPELPADLINKIMDTFLSRIGGTSTLRILPEGYAGSTVSKTDLSAYIGYMASAYPVSIGAIAAATVLPAMSKGASAAEDLLEENQRIPLTRADSFPDLSEPEDPPQIRKNPEKKTRKEKQQQRCLDNLRQINGAVQQYLLENGTEKMPETKDLTGYFMTGSVPTCPSGGEYTLPANSIALPRCSHPGHVLE